MSFLKKSNSSFLLKQEIFNLNNDSIEINEKRYRIFTYYIPTEFEIIIRLETENQYLELKSC